MRSVYILFLTEESRVRGFGTLAKRAQINSLPGHVYQIPIDSLNILESENIGYRRATAAEAKAANDQVRNPTASVL